MVWPVTAADVAAQLGTPVRDVDAGALDRATAAAVDYVQVHVPAPLDTPAVTLGTCLLAARWFARRGSPGGFASFGEFGPAYVRSTDPDVARLLGLDRPVVG
jgi:hypothetical protein